MIKKVIALFIISISIISCNDSSDKSITIENNVKTAVQNSENELNENVFSNDPFPVSFTYPKDWEIAEDTLLGILHVLSPKTDGDNFQEMVNVVVGGTSGNGLDAFFEGNLSAIQGMFAELSQTEPPSYQTINGLTFKKVRYNYVFEGLPLTAQLFVSIKGDDSFIINCSALQNTFDNYSEEFQSIVNSIEVK